MMTMFRFPWILPSITLNSWPQYFTRTSYFFFKKRVFFNSCQIPPICLGVSFPSNSLYASSDNSTSRKLLVSFHLLVSFDLFFISLHFRTISCYGPDVCSDSSFCSSILMFVDKCVCLSLNTCLSTVMLDIISVS